jgi:hypothetical protein
VGLSVSVSVSTCRWLGGRVVAKRPGACHLGPSAITIPALTGGEVTIQSDAGEQGAPVCQIPAMDLDPAGFRSINGDDSSVPRRDLPSAIA